jgi:putative oxidoreductase
MSTLSTILAVILGVAFLAAGITKLTRQPRMVENFKRWGYADVVLMATGALEVLVALMLLVGIAVQALAVAGGLVIVFIMLGALMTHQRARDKLALWLAPVVLLALDVALLVSLLPEG